MRSWKATSGRLGYRADLDGLRAVAVIAVVLFHLDAPFVPGGFVGVDVFFVLSGYFITRQIALECSEDRFSILSFYDRRIRRLLPALFVMLCVTAALAFLVLLPDDYDRFGISLKAAALSASNFYFWQQSDYFAPAADTMPLLHTWSLAVEEQFYLVFPILLVFVWQRWRALLWPILAILAAVSFALSVWATRVYPEAAFYLLPHRAWELLIGSLIALMPNYAPRQWWLRNVSALAGVAGIGAAIAVFDVKMDFPGFAAALPCLASALVIWSGQPAVKSNGESCSVPVVLRGLALPPFVFVGLISYSLYLWHWPLIVLGKYASLDGLKPEHSALLAILSFGIAIVSWRFIEQPLRHGGFLWPVRSRRFWYAGAASVALVALGTVIDRERGFPFLNPPELLAAVDDAKDSSPLRQKCHAGPSVQGSWNLADTCVFGNPSGRNVVVFGDSHAAEISFALSEQAEARGLRVRQITASSCPPALGVSTNTRPQCGRFINQMMSELAEGPHTTFVLSAFYFGWSQLVYSASFWDGLDKAVAELRREGHDVLLLGPVPPHSSQRLPYLLAKLLKYGMDPTEYTFPIDQIALGDIDRRLKGIASKYGATYVPLVGYVCGDTHNCRIETNGHAIYFDRHHLSATMARSVVNALVLPALSRQAGL